jgi:hypothetical protein
MSRPFIGTECGKELLTNIKVNEIFLLVLLQEYVSFYD